MKRLLNSTCSVCKGDLESALKLPDFPLTGIYSSTGQDKHFANYDQELLFCSRCGHAQLKNMVDIDFMYGDTYGFRTSASMTASGGARFFLNYLDTLFPGKSFNSIVDFGCNDGYLLKLLQQENMAKQYLGVDLIWQEELIQQDGIYFSGQKVEDINFKEILGEDPDLVLSQHTMEHIEDPQGLLQMLFENTGADTTFILEFPCLDPLLENVRFDQVFHQHLHYFSVQSFLYLLKDLGAELIDFTINYNYWGALIIAFKKSSGFKNTQFNVSETQVVPQKSIRMIDKKYQLFKQQMEITALALEDLQDEVWYGYGAALMLPILGYHLNIDFSNFRSILDDDPLKAGQGYINLPVKIEQPKDIGFESANILLTALDNRLPILHKLHELHPKRILNPLLII